MARHRGRVSVTFRTEVVPVGETSLAGDPIRASFEARCDEVASGLNALRRFQESGAALGVQLGYPRRLYDAVDQILRSMNVGADGLVARPAKTAQMPPRAERSGAATVISDPATRRGKRRQRSAETQAVLDAVVKWEVPVSAAELRSVSEVEAVYGNSPRPDATINAALHRLSRDEKTGVRYLGSGAFMYGELPEERDSPFKNVVTDPDSGPVARSGATASEVPVTAMKADDGSREDEKHEQSNTIGQGTM